VAKPTIPEVLPLVLQYYAEYRSGGNLHLVLDDGNVNNEHVLYCWRLAKERDDALGVQIAELLLQMSKTQRLKLGAKL
jgi:hypothetical protein